MNPEEIKELVAQLLDEEKTRDTIAEKAKI
jgi:hypothetical protein